MLEAIILLALSALIQAGALALWRAIGGPARSWRGRAGRSVGLGLLITLIVFFAAWQISRARAFQLMGDLVRRVETDAPAAALTFDDGPAPGYTEAIIRILQEADVPATFMVTGQAMEAQPAEARALVAAGHELGNHSYSHTRMIFKSYAFVRDEIERTDALIRAAGQAGPIHFRPPYSKRLFVLPYYLSRTGRISIFCDVEPESYAEVDGNAGKIAQYVLDHARPGSIILLHVMNASRAETLKAVPAIIQGLKAEGYRLVTVSELLALR